MPLLSGEDNRTISTAKPKALFALGASTLDLIYAPLQRRALEELANFYVAPQTRDTLRNDPGVLAEAEVIFSGWEAPLMDEAFLRAAPKLRAVFYGAGSIDYCVSEAFWDREIVITSASAANAQPVAEYTLGTILLSLKNFWQLAASVKLGEGWGDHTRSIPGGFGATVALVGCGLIARRVLALLKSFDLRCIVYDPFISKGQADELGVELCSLDEAFMEGDVISLHLADKPATRGLITGRHFSLMKSGATFINTARGRILLQEEMIAVLENRPDLTAILDVCNPEPCPMGSRLLELGNVILTPHIAGSHGGECLRMGQYMVEEFQRYMAGEPLKWQITREMAARTA